jgi:hypothetical protein
MEKSDFESTETHQRHREALEKALANPTEHQPKLITSHRVRQHMHRDNPFGRFNSRLAVTITKTVGTMWCAYVFFFISLVSFPQALRAFMHGDTVTGVSWLSQSFLQLVLLPIIIVGQNVISAAQDARAEADHITLTVLHTINVQQLRILQQEQKILNQLEKRSEGHA